MTATLTPPAAPPAASEAPARARAGGNPAWATPALVALLLATGVLYLWNLSASGWGNAFYAAAAQAGGDSWKAWFFGSSDASNFITVDKTPAALWITGLSVRIFGLNSWSVLAPQALIGVATVWLLYLTVRRWHGPAAGLLAGAVLASTPVATLMFRFNNPDALLMLLLVAGVYGVLRAVERGSTWWLLFAGSMVGFGFLTKMLQALLVVPAFGLAYLLFAPTGRVRRLVQLLAAGAAVIVSAGWWVAIVSLTPASWRPYVGGSQTNSILELTLGYNGFGRLTGNETGSVGGGGGGWGATGWSRLLDGATGGQASWLLPAALILAAAGLVWSARKAAYVVWGGWLVTTALVFSYMQGIFHDYYTVALAPAIGALVGMGAMTLWRRRADLYALLVLGGTVAITAVWSYILLNRATDFHPWLRVAVLAAGALGAAGILLSQQLGRGLRLAAAALALFAVLGGPVAYSLNTAATAHTGSIVTAGPTVAGGNGFGGGGRGFPAGGNFGGGFGGNFGGGGGGGGMGGLLNATTPSSEVVAALRQDSSKYTWVAAAVGSNNASGYQLAGQLPVMAIGGFNGSDPAPSLAQFQQYVREGKIHYFIGGSGLGGRSNGGSSVGAEIAAWVQANYTATTIGGTTLYDLTT
ncbi:glycosyltransferase family 39 protein [Dactylosporangium vinaceum]|uniref:ArnT family glycosyltransferase n=1 Tax=Dactylosporangium vinaceum TaxID=53362 RepID=A0ABV5M5A9_9ACTN|nr:glycosyltransferase family 39 protein [Dactylosporangium vinaceum]UAB96044.1 glycosyltransferase family 39 protein [Dactylosporangium vinaceum]